jgi:glycosyltransferase involved in cell wall biosynthesis
MHVLIVGDHPMPGEVPHGGVQRVVQSLRLALARKIRVTLLVPQEKENVRYSDAAGDIICFARSRIPSFLSYWNLLSRRIGCEIAYLSPDVVHVHGAAGYTLAWPKDDWAWPLVLTPHGMHHKDALLTRQGWLQDHTAAARGWIIKWVERYGRSRVDDLIVINDYVIEELPDVSKHLVHKIPNPVEDIFLRGEPGPRRLGAKLKIAQIGVVNQRKNAIDAIALAAALISSGRPVSLEFIGPIDDVGYFEICKAEIERLGLTDSVRFIGELSPSEIVRKLDLADVLLVTSLQETAPVVVAEAQCRGLPVAVPRAFGLRYMVEEGVNGLFLDGQSATENADKLVKGIDGHFDHDCIAREARKQYDIHPIADRTIEVYQQAILRRRRVRVDK